MVVVSLEFLALAAVVALAGTFLARSADQFAEITRLGRLLIGSVLLAAATSLPELTVDVSAVRQGMPDLAAGDLLGSSLMNLLILAVLDRAHRSGGKMFSREAAAHALSATLSIALTALAGLAILTAPRLQGPSLFGVGIWSWGILVAYLFGVRMRFSRSTGFRARSGRRRGSRGTGVADVADPGRGIVSRLPTVVLTP